MKSISKNFINPSNSIIGDHKSLMNRIWILMKIFYYIIESFLLFLVPRLVYKRSKSVKSETVLITGSGSGIGQLMAKKFLELGAKVVLWDICSEGMQRTKRICHPDHIDRLHCYQIDLTQTDQILPLAERVRREVGPVNILVNNAGVVNGKNILDLSEQEIEWTFQVNTLSHFATIKAFIPDMIKQKHGHIVTISSLCGQMGVARLTDYCASKFANIGMDLSLRLELAKLGLQDQIHMTIIKPWLINTGMFAGASPGPFLPNLRPEYVAEQIIQSILWEEPELTIPSFLSYLVPWLYMLPSKCMVLCYDFLGGFESMDGFVGRPKFIVNDKNNNYDHTEL